MGLQNEESWEKLINFGRQNICTIKRLLRDYKISKIGKKVEEIRKREKLRGKHLPEPLRESRARELVARKADLKRSYWLNYWYRKWDSLHLSKIENYKPRARFELAIST